MKIINNITEKLSDELKQDLRAGSRLSIAAACFSVYAFEELKTQLLQIDALRFIFTSPTFLAEQPKQEQREFYIPRRNREKALHGSEFEIRLRNAFTQRAISKECADWIRQKAVFKSNSTDEQMPGFLTVDGDAPSAYAPISGFTRAELGCERGGNMFSMINKIEAPESKAYLTLFGQLWADRRKMKDVTEQVLERITTAYRENSPEFLYFFALYHIFSDFLTNVSADDLPNDTNGFRESKVWNKLYTFQKDAVLAIISKLEQYNGCILADSVGLGKTFTALAIIKYYENRNLRVLVLCPKKLADNWTTYKANYVNNPIAADRLRYDVLYHIFTAFSDTAEYLFTNISTYAKETYGLNTALVTGSVDGRTSVPKFKADLNNILTCFSPISKDKAALMPDGPDIDILIATDCISEGQNLQDCDCLVNYDIHWNPVRLVQRFGRIDRIGSRNDKIQLINFWPDLDLDSYINLKARVELRMKALVMTSTGDDNLLSPEEQGDLEYRRQQLQRLQTEVVDLEEMGTGVSITDLGLNEFRMELLEYSKTHPELENSPGGISAVAAATPDAPPGVVFVLKNVHNEVDADQRNRLHPYYLVYLSEEGVTVHDHLSPKDTLDAMRQLCRGKDKPIEALYQAFNRETNDGRDMAVYSGLLEDAVLSILDAKEDSDLDSLFSAGGTSALLSQVSGLDDFELICFLVVREEPSC